MSKKKKRSRLQVLVNDNQASLYGAETKKTFHKKDIKYVAPLTETQTVTMDCYHQGDNLFLFGSAGCGKTFLAMYMALMDVLDERTEYHKLIIVRSAVATRDIGFLPGTEEEKLAIYEAPYTSICDELFHVSKAYENLKKLNYVKFVSSSFLRGITFDHSIVLVDEMQNLDDSEFNTIMTRIGYKSKIIFAGDTQQKDLKNSGIEKNMKIFNKMNSMTMLKFGIDDIVRSDLVREYIIAREELD